MTFDLQTILVQDQTFHLCNHAQGVMQLLALEYVQLTIEDPFVVKVVFVLNRICLAQNFVLAKH
jgi:hypothetical protein